MARIGGWMEAALCREGTPVIVDGRPVVVESDWWTGATGADCVSDRLAQRICAECPVLAECDADGLKLAARPPGRDMLDGIPVLRDDMSMWAGVRTHQRRGLTGE